MKHLKVEQIIDFVSLTQFDSEAVALSATVNGHIRKCQKCLRLAKAFQMIHDEFSNMHICDDFKQYVNTAVTDLEPESEKTLELQLALEQYDG